MKTSRSEKPLMPLDTSGQKDIYNPRILPPIVTDLWLYQIIQSESMLCFHYIFTDIILVNTSNIMK